MSLNVWGDLPKAQDDPTTIDTEIASLISDHNDDPDAHLETGQSLQSHKASEIIDHIAESVVNDKLKPNARSVVAVVDPESESDFSDIQSAINYAFEKGGGQVYIVKGRYKLSADLEMKYGVDLIGDGPNETLIDFQDGNYKIKSAKFPSSPDGYYQNVQVTNGSKIVTFPAGTNLITNKFQPGMRLYNYDDPTSYYEIASIDSETQLSLVNNYTGTTGTYEVYVGAWATFTNGSKTITFATGQDLEEWGIYPTSLLGDFEEYAETYQIDTIDSATQLTLLDNFPYATFTGFAYFDVSYLLPTDLQEIGIDRCGATYALDANDNGNYFNLDNVYINNSKGAIRANATAFLGKISHCYFNGSDGDYLTYLWNYRVENSTLRAWGTMDAFYRGLGNTIFSNCKLEADSSDAVALIYSGGNDIIFQNCQCLYLDKYDLSSTVRTRLNILGCHLSFNADKDLDFVHTKSRIGANYMTFSGTGKPHLTSASSKNVFSDNISTDAITDDGTSNVVADNVTTA